MARLGELLVATGLLTVEQVEQALRAQVMWGGRLGTNLIELGHLDLDKLAQALGRQHRLPAALGRHFLQSEPELQRLLAPDLAERFSCVPLLRAGAEKAQVIVASIMPLDHRAVTLIAGELGVTPRLIVQSVAGELRIRYHLERVYKIPRTTRFLRPRGKTIPPFPQFDIDPLAFEDSQVDNVIDSIDPPTVPRAADPVDPPTVPRAQATLVESADDPDDDALDEAAIAELREELRTRLDSLASTPPPGPVSDRTLPMPPMEFTAEEAAADPAAELDAIAALEILEGISVPEEVVEDDSSGRERRRYVRTIDSEPTTDSERRSLGRIAIRKVTAAKDVEETPVSTGATLGEATRAIRRSHDRERVADLVIETLFRFTLSCEAATMLVVRGDAAMSWKGFCRSGAPLADIAVPMDQPGLVPNVIERNQTVRATSSELSPIDQLMLVSLGQQAGELVVVPVSIAGQVMCVIAMVTTAEPPIATAESIAAAAGAAFARLMRNASR